MDYWMYERNIEINLSRQSNSIGNTTMKLFNGLLRQEYLNQSWFLSLVDAKQRLKLATRSIIKPDPIQRWNDPYLLTLPGNMQFPDEEGYRAGFFPVLARGSNIGSG